MSFLSCWKQRIKFVFHKAEQERMMNLQVGKEGLELIKSFEGCRLEAYPDPGTGGAPWTIGWGTTAGVTPGMRITQQEADDLLAEDVGKAAGVVTRLVKVPLNQNQFDALTSFVYNCGAGNFQQSTLLRLLNEGAGEAAADEFPKWVHGGNGATLPGLVRRRAAERSLFLTEVAAS
jgi:lysozyme